MTSVPFTKGHCVAKSLFANIERGHTETGDGNRDRRPRGEWFQS